MSLQTIAILSPGDMGHAVGLTLANHGFKVITCLEGRSDRTRALAKIGMFQDVSDLDSLVMQADIILSILVPSHAETMAEAVAAALVSTGKKTLYADCNAIAPKTTHCINAIITNTGSKFIDASIIGSPPGRGVAPRIYVSGPEADLMVSLDKLGLDIKVLGESIGRASAIKMCYAALTKGTSALHLALLTAAEAMGLSQELKEEFQYSESDVYRRMEKNLPALPVKAGRWVGEMKEIATAFEDVGVTGYFHNGAAEIFELLNTTAFAKETPETLDSERTLQDTIEAIAQRLFYYRHPESER
ncbi:NAD(P)-dependent oxidoreductase [SAR202 cluster bacterium AD-802-E10_MRT_200m]|nr:NAD(P)-dependent oxidoreductase [SAR202 cluster bacterium AD-802-E10_MRT_200m]